MPGPKQRVRGSCFACEAVQANNGGSQLAGQSVCERCDHGKVDAV